MSRKPSPEGAHLPPGMAAQGATGAPLMRRRALLVWSGASAPVLLGACGSLNVGIGAESPPQTYLALRDPGAAPARRAAPLVPTLVIQALPADALADTAGIAYARKPHEYAYYQLASWTDRPVRQLPRLLQRRLEARGTAAAIGQNGDPLRSDWLLTLSVNVLYHDVSVRPGQGRVALSAELHDRRNRRRVARRSFEATAPAAREDSSAGAEAMSLATGRVFDELVPWLEAELERAVAASGSS
jgi:cholesterol transport system auxiliary component